MCVLNAIIVNGASHLTEFDQAGVFQSVGDTFTKLHSLEKSCSKGRLNC